MAKENINPFKMSEHSMRDVPEGMKKKVMNDVAMAKLVMEMASLFTCNYKDTINEMLKTNS